MGIWDVKKISLFLLICSNFQIKLFSMQNSFAAVCNSDIRALLIEGVSIRSALDHIENINFKYELGKTILHLAIDCINPDKRDVAIKNIEFLLSNKDIDILAVDRDNRNVIHYAAIKKETEVVGMVIEKLKKQEKDGADLKLALNSVDLIQGRTPLHYAVVTGNVESTLAMLLNGADLQIKDSNEFSVAYYIRNTKDPRKKNLFKTLVKACCS